MGLPQEVTRSRLWQRMVVCSDHGQAIADIRQIAEALGRQVERTLPEYTDHSIKHMDALWLVADQILRKDECKKLTPAEAFILGSCFYVHDLGMAFAATEEGLAGIRSSKEYVTARQRLSQVISLPSDRIDLLAVRIATRDLHAQKCFDLVEQPLPGLGRYLIENTETREAWAHTIGQIAASHHWNLEQLHNTLGIRNVVPTAGGGTADLGLIACVLRLVDYAHINRERSSNLERALRSEISADSIVHWDAQSNIVGPSRESDLLVYGSTSPIDDVDAWWLFYDLASGLDAEIRSVSDYLRGRANSADKFSLQGVKGVELPKTFSQLVELSSDTSPIDIRIQPHSMERVIELLGGPHLYGADRLAPIRELIQNARDAIALRTAIDKVNAQSEVQHEITLTLERGCTSSILSVKDNGIGMTRSVVVRHLISVGSDFWHSAEFYRDYGKALEVGFRPIGKFGIGFLSVFMIGDRVEVETESLGSCRVLLRLRGLGRRGELRELPPTGKVGTEVRITLKQEVIGLLTDLVAVARARAPMLQIPIVVRVPGESSWITERIEPGWWQHVENRELQAFVHGWPHIAYGGALPTKSAPGHELYQYRHSVGVFRAHGSYDFVGWPGDRPQFLDGETHVASSGGAEYFGVVRCSQGIAVDKEFYDDLTGITEIGPVELLAARGSLTRRPVDEPDEVMKALLSGLQPHITAKLNDLERFGMIPARIRFIRGIASVYGEEALATTSLRWIPLVEPPGNLIHHSRKELIERLRSQEEIILGCGVDPGAAYGFAAPHIPSDKLGRTIILALPIKEIEVDWQVMQRLEVEASGETIEGNLDEVLRKTETSASALILMTFLINAIGEAWGISTKTIQEQQWHLNYKREALWAIIDRSKL